MKKRNFKTRKRVSPMPHTLACASGLYYSSEHLMNNPGYWFMNNSGYWFTMVIHTLIGVGLPVLPAFAT